MIDELYEDETAKCEKQIVRHQKLFFVGESDSGKTSLLKALTNRKFIPEHISTLGVVINPIGNDWKYEDDFKAISHNYFKVNIENIVIFLL